MRRIPNRLLPHRDLVTVEQFKGGAAGGRSYAGPHTVGRALIIDDVELLRNQYDSDTALTAVVYFERSEVADVPSPETKVTIWAGTDDERTAHVVKCGRYQHPQIADLLEVKLR